MSLTTVFEEAHKECVGFQYVRIQCFFDIKTRDRVMPGQLYEITCHVTGCDLTENLLNQQASIERYMRQLNEVTGKPVDDSLNAMFTTFTKERYHG